MKTKILLAILLFTLLNISISFSQTLVNYPRGNLSPDIVAANMFATNITASTGITPVACSHVSAEVFNQTSWINGLNNGDYWEFTITPNNGYDVNISNISIKRTGSNRTNPAPPAQRTILYKIGNGSWTYIAGYNSYQLGTNICSGNSSGNNTDIT